MKKPTGKKRPQINLSIDQPAEDQPEIILPNSIQSFLKTAQRGGNEISVILYRREQKGQGRPKLAFLEQYENEAPSLKEIALNYGGGNYQVQIISEGTDTEAPHIFKSFSFNIDDTYTEKKDRSALLPAAIDPAQQFNQSIAMITGLVQAISPLFAARPAAEGNPSALIASMADIGNSMLSQSFKNQIESQKMVMEAIRENSTASQPEPEEDKTFDRIMQALEMFIPIFLQSPAGMQRSLVKTAQAAPEVKGIINNANKTAALKKQLIAKFGPEKAGKIFKIFEKAPGGNGKAPKAAQPQPEPAAAA